MEWILFALAAVIFAIPFFRQQEKEPEEKVTGTGVVEKVIGESGRAQYVVRFTGAQNRSYLGRTPLYTGNTDKYAEGKLVHIRYWFGKKGKPGVEITDEALARVEQKPVRLRLCCWLLGAVLLELGVVFLAV